MHIKITEEMRYKDSDSNACGGFKCCENREFDMNNKECQECLDDYEQSLTES